MITVLAGGVGGARFLRGLMQVVDPESISAIVNVADDFVLHGLSISPDLDTVRYTLIGDVGDAGWGRSGDTAATMTELARLSSQAPDTSEATPWFHLGDRDLATHLYRSQRIHEGATLTQITAELCRANELAVRLLPVSDDPVRTMVELADGEVVSFQRYFVGLRHGVPIRGVSFQGVSNADAGPDVLDAILSAERVIIAPSNPFVSIAPVLAVAGVADAIRDRRDQVIAISPIVDGHAIKGPAGRMLTELGYEPSAVAVSQLWAPFASTFVVDLADKDKAAAIEAGTPSVRCVATSTIMSDLSASTALAADVMALPLLDALP